MKAYCKSIFRIVFSASLFIVFALGASGCSSGDASGGGKKLYPRFIPGKFDITIVNDGSPEASGKQIVIHVNGDPPGGFKGTFTFPALNQTVTIHLDELVNEEGRRFNPREAITAFWIGGNGYAFSNYAK